MYNIDSAFTVDNDGLVFEDGVWLTSGSSSPSGLFTPLVPTRYYRTNGDEWYHTGSGSWVQEVSGSTVPFDENIILVNHNGDVLTNFEGNVLRRF
jgi:hypothetical protein